MVSHGASSCGHVERVSHTGGPETQAVFLHLPMAQDGSPLPHHTLPVQEQVRRVEMMPWKTGRLEVADASPRVTHILCTAQKCHSIQTYLREGWEWPGVENAGFEGSHISPGVAGSPLLENPIINPHCTHGCAHCRLVLATPGTPELASLTGPLPTYCLTLPCFVPSRPTAPV